MKRHSGERKARALIALASRSVGSKQATQAYKLHLEQLLDEYDLACQQLKTVEAEINAVLDRIPFAKSMLAVKGISAISLAGILGEAGDLSRFVHGNALLRHAGLNLAEASSGKWTGQMKISKRGRSRLRRFIFMMTMSLIANNPEFKAIHAHNVQVKKMKKMRSLMKLCGKLARVLVGMARSREDYNPHKTMSIQLAAYSLSNRFVVRISAYSRDFKRKHGVPDTLNQRALTRTDSKTGLHPLDRRNEGMRGQRPVETWE
ncbi:Transposase IS116/IS110/IS902 family protein [Paenibacillus sp. UNC496MF]|nr:Transposase IS116/IS110/IS902 family protein [Paenibacillus sp. UNC496MF]